ncbi:protein son of sevenless isoform X2 [Musca domestica]|uniref:Protein son of sevenless isoform X2 n=1 Tax=Musca domestica TaxID=7370 RepID=A0ABM3VEU0_MUSDO|nr:protein son of sevenless isoform X2 [Musca domestica]
MFSVQHGNMGSSTIMGDSDVYDFTKAENIARWKGIFIPSLKKVLEQVHPRLTAKEEALMYVETLCLRILAMLCAKPLPHTVQDIEEKVRKYFPSPIDCWALNEAKETLVSKKRKSVLPTERVHTLLQKDVLQYKIDNSVSVFLVAVLEYISADILKLAGNYVRKIKHCEISKEDIEVAMCADKVLMDMFYQPDIKSNVLPSPLPTLPAQRTSTTYEEVVKDLINDEKQYQRDLHMIIRVFREELVKIVKSPKEIEQIFSNIMDIYEVTVTLLSSLEDVIEMSQEQSAPCVGSCFEELAEAEEFDVYTKYAQEVTSQSSRDALTTLLARPDAMSLMSAGHGFRDAVKYYLPKLLLVPIWHAFMYFDYIKILMKYSPSQDDIESFEQVQGLLRPLRNDLENIVATLPKESCIAMSSRARRQLAIERTRELQNTVEHFDKDVGQNCNEFIREDVLGKLGSGKKIAERKAYLFDGLMLLCKPNTKRQTTSASSQVYEYRLKEKFYMRRVEINDRPDSDDLKYAFDVAPRVQPPVTLAAKNSLHKNDWMADLIMVNTKSMLDRILDSILLDIEKKHPLRMPSSDMYRFAEPDSPDNIVLEERESAGVPLIKGATLCKLVERLTYHIYADPMFVRTFLTTYRYFCTPQNLLSLLIERFNIPDPSLVYTDNNDKDCEPDKLHKNSQREDWKRYRKEYVQPVQFRVLNVLRHWVDHHFYDFEKDPSLLENLLQFLENVNGKSMRKWVDSVLKIVQRKRFLENLDPFKGMSDTDISNFLYHESLRIEPRGCKQPPKFPRKWSSISLKSPGIKPRRQNVNSNVSSTSMGSNNAQPNSTSCIQPVTARSPAVEIPGGEQPSPNVSWSNAAANDIQAFSVFANVNIPDRNGTKWTSTSVNSNSSSSFLTQPLPIRNDSRQLPETEDAPILPKKPNSGSCLQTSICPTLSDTSSSVRLDSVFSISEEYSGQPVSQSSCNRNAKNQIGIENETPSPLPKLVVSPLREHHYTNNRSPFHCTTSTNKTSNFTSCNFSSSECALISTPNSTIYNSEMDFYNTIVPVSPHVNVPTSASIQYRTAPPPLPPRRKERTESCADMAQKRQAPDAPMLPPRDGDLSPPPIPPRINNQQYIYHSNFQGYTNNVSNTSSLLLPNTSTIMIRRNSAIEKRTAMKPTAKSSASPLVLSNSTTVSISSPISTSTSNVPIILPHLSHLCTTTSSDDQSISPALSSSTTSPMTPMTPISPHIPAGYLTTDISHNQICLQNVSSSSTFMFSKPPSLPHQRNQNQQIQHNNISVGSQPRSICKELCPNTDSLPKLPPKPSLGGNVCNNSEKCTMFPYPSTNHE